MQTSSTMFGAHDAKFNAMKEKVTQLKEEPDNQVKLQLYALFKQVFAYALGGVSFIVTH